MLTSYKYPPGEQRKKEKKLALQLHTLHLVTIVIKLSMQDNYLKRVYHSMMLYGVRSLTKRRGREEETIALMALPLVRIQIINEIRITTVNLLIYHVTAIFRLRQSKPFSNVNEIQKDTINSILHLIFFFFYMNIFTYNYNKKCTITRHYLFGMSGSKVKS